MSRKTDRHLIRDTLAALDVFQVVYGSEVRTFGGMSPVVTMSSQTQAVTQIGRGVRIRPGAVQVTIWISAETSDLEAVEDTLDDLSEQAIAAVEALGFEIVPSTTEPYNAPLNDIGGKAYRAERFVARRVGY